ncbi:Ig-like domain-containing protein [Actinoplanes missouriensis]|uniref:Ig-like domain-containing protein n=1 Tax=Actinoplanes missouriensis TaxID=1866 RepID=UPI0034015F2D
MASPAAAAEKKSLPYILGIEEGTDPADLLTRLGFEPDPGIEVIRGVNAVRVDLKYVNSSEIKDKLEVPTPGLRYAQMEKIVDLNESAPSKLTGRELETVQLPTGKTGSEAVTVAVLDTGVTPNRNLPPVRVVPGHDARRLPFVDIDYQPPVVTTDDAGYGTMAAGIIAGDSGVCPTCKIMPVKIANPYPGVEGLTALSASLAEGLVWATDNGADIITTPAVVRSDSKLIAEAVQYATANGVLVVASAGKNLYNGEAILPAGTEPVLAVSAVDTAGKVTGSYAYGDWVDVAAAEGAPAVNHRGESSQLDGVEGATAVVAGTAALAFASKPGADPVDVRKAIVETAAAGELPVLNAGHAVYRVAGDDSADPVITSTGLTTDQVITKPIDVKPVVSDDYGIKQIELTAGGKTVTTRYPWETLRFTPPADFSGRLAVSLKVTDFAGKATGETTVVRVETVKTAGVFLAPAAGAHIRGAAKVVFRGSANIVSAKVNGVPMVKQGGDWAASATPNRGSLVVEATDRLGTVTRYTRAVVVDNDGPTATAVNPKQNTRVRGTFTTSLSGVKDASGVAKAELWANGKYLGAGYSKKVATGKASGNVKLVWKLTDKLGNSRSYTRIVIADNKAPSVSITKAPKNKAKVKNTVKVYVKASDASGIARVELIVNGKVVATDKTSGYVLSVNTKKQKKSMQVRVRAYDKLGNVTYTTTRTWYRK